MKQAVAAAALAAPVACQGSGAARGVGKPKQEPVSSGRSTCAVSFCRAPGGSLSPWQPTFGRSARRRRLGGGGGAARQKRTTNCH